jgi:hypothetical protein
MQSKTPPQSFLQAVILEVGNLPPKGWVCLAAWGVLSAGGELVVWSHRPGLLGWDYVLMAATVASLAAVAFLCTTLMAGSRLSWRAALGFFGTGAAQFLPLGLWFGLLALAAKYKALWLVWPGGLLCLSSLLALALLPGWPVWQAAAERFIGPVEAYRATRGLRWPLLAAAITLGALSGVTPKISTANDLMTASAIAMGDSLVNCLNVALGIAVSVAAFRAMRATDFKIRAIDSAA